jgi:hypothetical protein
MFKKTGKELNHALGSQYASVVEKTQQWHASQRVDKSDLMMASMMQEAMLRWFQQSQNGLKQLIP